MEILFLEFLNVHNSMPAEFRLANYRILDSFFFSSILNMLFHHQEKNNKLFLQSLITFPYIWLGVFSLSFLSFWSSLVLFKYVLVLFIPDRFSYVCSVTYTYRFKSYFISETGSWTNSCSVCFGFLLQGIPLCKCWFVFTYLLFVFVIFSVILFIL